MKVLKISYYAVMVLLLAWFAVSYVDIIADNCSMNPVHYSWNMFTVMVGGVK